ncbi:MAG TPA: cytochrome c3 family protein, partial [Steroidobacteraceae bacterium]|nr:cytochrome c3 family protein [Steroidobacteraceae bacterium]
CHKNISDHVHPDRAQLAGADAMGKVQRCASCHREHGESLDELIPRADQLCTSCHAKGATRFANLKLLDVSAFEEKLHPPFAPRLLVPASSDGLTWKMEKTPLATASDHSNLKFSHRQHLDKDRVIRSSDGGALNCGDCHRPTLDGKRFLPITMQETCSSCHELSFDPAAPERQLPHGKPREAILVLQEYYARRYSDPAAAPVVRERRRLPGRSDEVTVCTAGPLPCARQAAANEIEGQFTRRGCVTCHEVNDTQNADIYERYQVRPVKLSTDFFPAARFDHAPHRIQKDRTGDAACLACHKANESAESSDLLLPDEPKCLECHRTHPGTSLGAEQIVSPCIACHEYHPRTSAAQLTMSDAGVTSKKP